MKSQFNKSIVAAVVLGTIVAPFAAFAQGTTTPRLPRNNFCTRITDDSQKLLRGFDPKMDGRTDRRAENEKARLDKLAGLRTTRDEKLKENRDGGQAKRDVRYDALMKKADTDAKKAAVTAFKTAVDAATAKRIAAVDAAIKAHRDGVDALVKTKFTTLDTGAATLKSTIDVAIAKAKTDCANNVAPQTVRASLIAAAKAAQDIFKANRNDVAIKTQLEALNTTRKTAVEAAMTQFKADMTAATTALKTAFGTK